MAASGEGRGFCGLDLRAIFRDEIIEATELQRALDDPDPDAEHEHDSPPELLATRAA